jgi:hypothetical protein
MPSAPARQLAGWSPVVLDLAQATCLAFVLPNELVDLFLLPDLLLIAELVSSSVLAWRCFSLLRQVWNVLGPGRLTPAAQRLLALNRRVIRTGVRFARELARKGAAIDIERASALAPLSHRDGGARGGNRHIQRTRSCFLSGLRGRAQPRVQPQPLRNCIRAGHVRRSDRRDVLQRAFRQRLGQLVAPVSDAHIPGEFQGQLGRRKRTRLGRRKRTRLRVLDGARRARARPRAVPASVTRAVLRRVGAQTQRRARRRPWHRPVRPELPAFSIFHVLQTQLSPSARASERRAHEREC